MLLKLIATVAILSICLPLVKAIHEGADIIGWIPPKYRRLLSLLLKIAYATGIALFILFCILIPGVFAQWNGVIFVFVFISWILLSEWIIEPILKNQYCKLSKHPCFSHRVLKRAF